MARCDICGGACDASNMKRLLESYQLNDIKDLCPDCSDWADSTKKRLLEQISYQMRSAILDRKMLYTQTPKIQRPRLRWIK